MKNIPISPAILLVAFLVGLSSALFLLPFWVGPFIAATKTSTPADWIGFAGNFGAGIMTLIAATLAWFAVQGQISAQDRIARIQTAMQKSDALNRQIESLEYDRLLFWKAALQAKWSLVPQAAFRNAIPDISFNQVINARDEYAERMKEVADLIDSCGEAAIKQWRFPDGIIFRTKLVASLHKLKSALADAHLAVAIKLIENETLKDTITPLSVAHQAACLKIDLQKDSDTVLAVVALFEKAVSPEIRRLAALLKAAQNDADI